jgi:plastocyanin
MVRRRILAPLALVGLLAAAVAVPAQAGSRKPQHKTVGVIDYAFTPAKLKVTPGSKITWRWGDGNSASHDVKLVSAPRGVRRFTSPTFTAGVTFSKQLKTAGTYRFICSYHVNMRETIIVR